MPNSTEKPKAIIFGASQSGLSALNKLAKDYDVVAFLDNSVQKVGTEINAIPVIAPMDLPDLDVSNIFIASEFFEQIEQQLVTQLGIPKSKVCVLPTSVIKPMSMGDSEQTLRSAELILLTICNALEVHQVPYHIDAGTLLGIYRDGGLIPWDDDLDVAVSSEYTREALKALEASLPLLQKETGYAWRVETHLANSAFGAVKTGDVRGIKLKCLDTEAKLPMLDIFLKYINGDTMDYVLSSRGIRMPSCHLVSTDELEFCGAKLAIPSHADKYLELHYGDWKTPVKDWHLGMLKNATVFE